MPVRSRAFTLLALALGLALIVQPAKAVLSRPDFQVQRDLVKGQHATSANSTRPGLSAPNHLVWLPRSDMPTRRAGFGVAVLANGKIYAVGGFNYGPEANPTRYPITPLDCNEEFDAVADTWTTRASMPTPRADLGAAAVNDKIYAIGGITETATLNTVEEYDPVADSWRARRPMLVARQRPAIVESQGIIYAFGGDDEGTVEAYDPTLDTWEFRASMPRLRYDMAAARTPDGRIYVIGGIDWASGDDTMVEEYDPVTDTWQTRASMATGRSRLAAVTLVNKIYAIGGYGIGGILDSVEEYDPATDAWQTDTPMPTPRASLGAVASGDRLYAIGGWRIAYTTFRVVETATFLHYPVYLPLASGSPDQGASSVVISAVHSHSAGTGALRHWGLLTTFLILVILSLAWVGCRRRDSPDRPDH